MKRWKMTKRERRRRWPWRHGTGHLSAGGTPIDAHTAYREGRWFIRTCARRNGKLNDLKAYLDRVKADCLATGQPLPLWHPDADPDRALAIAREEVHRAAERRSPYPVLSRQANGTLVLATYDERAEVLTYYRSADDGNTWTRIWPPVWPKWTEGLRWHHNRMTALVPVPDSKADRASPVAEKYALGAVFIPAGPTLVPIGDKGPEVVVPIKSLRSEPT